jgi:hypothetical protein
MVGLSDYDNDNGGFGVGFPGEDREITQTDLQKAMFAGNGGSGGSTANQGSVPGSIQPAITESLEATLKDLTMRREELKVWKQIKTSPAYALSEEFLQMTDFGADTGGFHDEFDTPEATESTYNRKSERVKYIGTLRQISHQAQLVRSRIGDVVMKEVENGTTWVMRRLNSALIYANASVVPAEFNGLYAQHSAYGGNDDIYKSVEEYYSNETVIDLRGKSLTQEVFFDAAEIVDDNHGYANQIFGPNSVVTDLAKDYIAKQRILLGQSTTTTFGAVPKSIVTPYQDIQLMIDKNLKTGKSRMLDGSNVATHLKAPAAPLADATAPVAATADTLTRFTDGAGDYFYAVAAVNKYGTSALTSLNKAGAKTSIGAGQSADLKFTAAPGTTTGFIIFRSKKSPATSEAQTPMYPIFKVSVTELGAGFDGAGNNLVRDRNRTLPGMEESFIWQGDDEVYEFKQLAPLMRMDLARIDTSTRFLILLYGTPQLYQPKKVIRLINIGKFEEDK